jgi:glycosyltransferase involved in cell wall biosynthesis
MMRRLSATLRFFADLARDLAGTLRGRWQRFQRRVVQGESIASIGVDIYPLLEQMTGVGWYEWSLLEALDARDDGLTFNLYADTFPGPADPVPSAPPFGQRMRLRVHPIPSEILLPIRTTKQLLTAIVEPVLRTLDGNDVLFAPNFFAHDNHLPHAGALVVTVHDLAYAVLPTTVAPETLEQMRSRMPHTLFHADRLIAVSAATAGDLAERLGASRRRVHIIHEGRDPRLESTADGPGAPADDVPARYLLFVSTIEPRKNVLGVLRAFRLAVEWGYEGSLLLVGRWGWRTDAIRRELASSPVRERVVHLDYVDRERLGQLYRHADALLYPSWMEGFGLPILEAMTCGTPVITSGRSSMPEVAGSAAVYVDPSSPHSIASGVASLLADDSNRRRLVRIGRERAGRFSWERAAAATAQALRAAAGLPVAGDDDYRV